MNWNTLSTEGHLICSLVPHEGETELGRLQDISTTRSSEGEMLSKLVMKIPSSALPVLRLFFKLTTAKLLPSKHTRLFCNGVSAPTYL